MEANGIKNNFLHALIGECKFTASRSSGPGGQHVNKVNTKVELKFKIPDSEILSEEQKEILLEKLVNKVNKEGYLVIVSQDNRSQLKNKECCIEKFQSLIDVALTPAKERKASKPTQASKIRRLDEKRKTSQKKVQRRPPDIQ